jgi:excinuclease ABC subunit C
MDEVLSRRYRTIDAANPEPDLLLVDGGKGQLGIAMAVLGRLGLVGRFAVAGIAKKNADKGEAEDKIYLPNRRNAVNLGSDGRLLLLLQQIRDEAHRFAITYQRRKRVSSTVRSALDRIHGVGPRRRATLMKHFGNLKKIRAATVEEISALPGINQSLAEAIKKTLV